MFTIFRLFFLCLLNCVAKFGTTFETNGTDNFAGGSYELMLNGQSKGKFNISGKTLGNIIRDAAKSYGLRTFSVYVDGRSQQLDTHAPEVTAVCVAQKIDLVAKDSRGGDLANSWTISVEGEAEEQQTAPPAEPAEAPAQA